MNFLVFYSIYLISPLFIYLFIHFFGRGGGGTQMFARQPWKPRSFSGGGGGGGVLFTLVSHVLGVHEIIQVIYRIPDQKISTISTHKYKLKEEKGIAPICPYIARLLSDYTHRQNFGGTVLPPPPPVSYAYACVKFKTSKVSKIEYLMIL